MPEYIANLFHPEYVFSLSFFLIVVGTGLWFQRSGWAWLAKFLEDGRRLRHEAEMERIRLEAEGDKRWQGLIQDLTTQFSSLQRTLGRFEAMQLQFMNNQELFFKFLINGGKNGEDNPGGGR